MSNQLLQFPRPDDARRSSLRDRLIFAANTARSIIAPGSASSNANCGSCDPSGRAVIAVAAKALWIRLVNTDGNGAYQKDVVAAAIKFFAGVGQCDSKFGRRTFARTVNATIKIFDFIADPEGLPSRGDAAQLERLVSSFLQQCAGGREAA